MGLGDQASYFTNFGRAVLDLNYALQSRMNLRRFQEETKAKYPHMTKEQEWERERERLKLINTIATGGGEPRLRTEAMFRLTNYTALSSALAEMNEALVRLGENPAFPSEQLQIQKSYVEDIRHMNVTCCRVVEFMKRSSVMSNSLSNTNVDQQLRELQSDLPPDAGFQAIKALRGYLNSF